MSDAGNPHEPLIDAVWNLENAAMDLRHAAQMRATKNRSDDDVLDAVRKLREAWDRLGKHLP